jgi:hypothetical protein
MDVETVKDSGMIDRQEGLTDLWKALAEKIVDDGC